MRSLPFILVALTAEAVWAGCGPRRTDPGLITLLVGLMIGFAISGPVVGTFLSELVLRFNGRPVKGLRVVCSLIVGGGAFALCAPALFSAGAFGFWSPLLAGAASFLVGVNYDRMTTSNKLEFENPDIGFEPGRGGGLP